MGFDIIEKGKRPLLHHKGFTTETLAFEMNLNLRTVERDVYNLLDWIRSLGGFQKGLRTIFQIFIVIFTYKRYETYMVS